jgi:XTP/dITP diphosphohydrolase
MSVTKHKIVLATQNPSKLEELRGLFAPLDWDLRAVGEFTHISPDEPMPTFVENAIIKARHASEVSGLPALADDSGLEVHALDGAPGVHSAYYAKLCRTGLPDHEKLDNMKMLLWNMRDIPVENRKARFVCVMVYLRHPEDPTPLIVRGTCDGTILIEPRGETRPGMFYDTIFETAKSGLTFAEMGVEATNKISHRAKAANLFSMLVKDFIKQGG